MKSTKDQKKIKKWAKECINLKLYVMGWCGRSIFEGHYGKIHCFAYEPGIGWAIIHDFPYKRNLSVYVKDEYRRKGLGRSLANLCLKRYNDETELMYDKSYLYQVSFFKNTKVIDNVKSKSLL